jgi:nucleotide-binding universal stress UspA family protein
LAKGPRDRLQAALPGWKVPSEALWGPTAKSILKTAEWFEPDLLVVGSHGRSAAARLVLGSVSLSLLHHANFPVRIVREKTPAPSGPIRILIATDGSPSALAAVDEVARRAWPAGAQARVVSVFATLVPEPTMIPALEGRTFATEPAFKVILEADEHERRRLGTIVEAAAKILEHAGLAVDAKVLDGDPRTDILREARNWSADTIFIGARGVGTLDRLLLGSVSTAVVTHADCTVEVIRRGKRSKL